MANIYRKRKRAPYTLELKGRAPRRILRAAPIYRKRTYTPRYESVLENKYVDYEVVASTIGTSWVGKNPTTIDCLSATAVGDLETERDGRVYHINSVHLRGAVSQPIQEAQGAPVDDGIVRILLVLDTQTNATAVTAADVMSTTGTRDIWAHRNLKFTKRFRVIKDLTIRLETSLNAQNEGAVNAFTTSGLKIPWQINHKFTTPIKVQCKLGTAVVGAINDNSLHIVAAASNATITMEYQSRVRFTK